MLLRSVIQLIFQFITVLHDCDKVSQKGWSESVHNQFFEYVSQKEYVAYKDKSLSY